MDRKSYLRFLTFVWGRADAVCFTVDPYLRDMEELRQSVWAALTDSVIATRYTEAPSDMPGHPHFLVFFRKDYCVLEFLKSRKNIFDFTEQDEATGILLEDLAFSRDGEIFCYTLTHEYSCDIAEEDFQAMPL
ncbi:MAG: hypothetical protein LUG55_05275 [Clostridiales bacterium]|nr:hypothetical protein [Clostridiales bacterium]